MATYTYKKLNDVITVTYEHAYAADTLLLYYNKPVFFGLENADKKYEGNLTQPQYTIGSDCDGCYAITIDDEQCTLNTALKIDFYVSKNDSENERTITYKYNNTPLFKILQSGFYYLYFNAIHLRSEFKNKSYMVKINSQNIYTINTLNMSCPQIYFNDDIIYYYYNPSSDSIPNINDTYVYSLISGEDILNGNIINKTVSRYPNIIGELNSNGEVGPVYFTTIKQTIQYIGIFYSPDGNSHYERALLIDFSESSKYKVE